VRLVRQSSRGIQLYTQAGGRIPFKREATHYGGRLDLGIRAPPAGSFVKRENVKKAKKAPNKKSPKKAQVPVDI